MRRVIRLLSLLAFALPCLVAAQEPPPPEVRSVGATSLRYVVRVPDGYAEGKWVPVLVVFPNERGEARALAAAADVASAVAAGFVVVVPLWEQALGVPDLRPLFAELRRTYRIDQGGTHALIRGTADDDVQVVRAHRHEFQTVSYAGALADPAIEALKRLPCRRVGFVPVGRLAEHLTDLHRQRMLPGVAGDVARVLDDFHDAAANGDEDATSRSCRKTPCSSAPTAPSAGPAPSSARSRCATSSASRRGPT